MKRTDRRLLIPVTAGLLALAGCNTVSGLGEDLRSASDATREAIAGDDDQPRTASTNDGSMPEKK